MFRESPRISGALQKRPRVEAVDGAPLKDAVLSAVEYAVDPCPLGWALRLLSPGGGSTTIDYGGTPAAARWAAGQLAAGQAHVEPHQPLGCKVQPGPRW